MVEDLITLRFGKLSSNNQLMLKIASVVYFHAEVVTPRIVLYVFNNCSCLFEDNCRLEAEPQPQFTLLLISKKITYEEAAIERLSYGQQYRFLSDKQRLVIYGIMVDKEKHTYHDFVSQYFASSCCFE